MFADSQGPIEHFSWGKFVIRGVEHAEQGEQVMGAGKDIRLVDTEVSEWAERHGHKLKFKMVTGIFERGIEILVIGIGVEGALECPEKTIQKIRSQGIEQVILARTPQACQIYNTYFHQGKRVALLAHGTC